MLTDLYTVYLLEYLSFNMHAAAEKVQDPCCKCAKFQPNCPESFQETVQTDRPLLRQ